MQPALDKEYVKSLIIAISLDPEDPQNIVEAYTFKCIHLTECALLQILTSPLQF